MSSKDDARTLAELDDAEALLLNTDLKAKRRLMAGDLTRAGYDELRRHIDGARANLQAVRDLCAARARGRSN